MLSQSGSTAASLSQQHKSVSWPDLQQVQGRKLVEFEDESNRTGKTTDSSVAVSSIRQPSADQNQPEVAPRFLDGLYECLRQAICGCFLEEVDESNSDLEVENILYELLKKSIGFNSLHSAVVKVKDQVTRACELSELDEKKKISVIDDSSSGSASKKMDKDDYVKLKLKHWLASDADGKKLSREEKNKLKQDLAVHPTAYPDFDSVVAQLANSIDVFKKALNKTLEDMPDPNTPIPEGYDETKEWIEGLVQKKPGNTKISELRDNLMKQLEKSGFEEAEGDASLAHLILQDLESLSSQINKKLITKVNQVISSNSSLYIGARTPVYIVPEPNPNQDSASPDESEA